MAYFYASIQGNRGQTTRMGTKTSGISGHIRGFEIGGKVSCWVDSEGNDKVSIFLTSGSDGDNYNVSLGTFDRKDLEKKWEEEDE